MYNFALPPQHDNSLPNVKKINQRTGIGVTMGSAFWYGYHMPRTNGRDNYYRKLEAERAERNAALASGQ